MFRDLLKHALGRGSGAYESLRQPVRRMAGLHQRRTGAGIQKRPTRTKGDLLACRYEFKYRISESKAEAITQFIKPYLHLDHYCKLQRSGSYPVVSLYLDSENLRLCWQTLEGQKNRFKLRIRSYADDPAYPRFFEIKRRMNGIIIKSRTRVKHNDVPALLSGLSLPPQEYETGDGTLKQFQFYARHIDARPVIRVRYIRRAYEGDLENRVRVTLDRHLAYNVSGEPEVKLGGRGWQRHSSKGVILEIKFTDCYPVWLRQMAKCFNLRRQSISKYVGSVKQSCLLGYFAPRYSV